MRINFVLLLLLQPVWAVTEIRVATYNASLALEAKGQLVTELESSDYLRGRQVAEVIQILQPDVLLLNEFDFDEEGNAMRLLNDNFFKVSQNGREVQDFPFRYTAPSNTGVHSGFDLDNNGVVDDTPGDRRYGGDAFGFGEFEGKFGMAVFSKYPIDLEAVRTFERVLWKDMPGSLLPTSFYSEEEQAVFRLSSKSHWDVPINVDGKRLHFLVSHPTPPVFDGPEDRNGRRNHDEIRLWADYLTAGANTYLGGGLKEEARFVIAGDQNADPTRGASVDRAINQLLDHPRVNSEFVPERSGSSSESARFDTATFRLRVDYVLPSAAGFEVQGGAVFWPTAGQDGVNLFTASDQDHRPVYLDLVIVPFADEVIRDLMLKNSESGFLLEWGADEDVSYVVETSPDLTENSWELLDVGEIVISEGMASVSIPRDHPQAFLRVRISGF